MKSSKWPNVAHTRIEAGDIAEMHKHQRVFFFVEKDLKFEGASPFSRQNGVRDYNNDFKKSPSTFLRFFFCRDGVA